MSGAHHVSSPSSSFYHPNPSPEMLAARLGTSSAVIRYPETPSGNNNAHFPVLTFKSPSSKYLLWEPASPRVRGSKNVFDLKVLQRDSNRRITLRVPTTHTLKDLHETLCQYFDFPLDTEPLHPFRWTLYDGVRPRPSGLIPSGIIYALVDDEKEWSMERVWGESGAFIAHGIVYRYAKSSVHITLLGAGVMKFPTRVAMVVTDHEPQTVNPENAVPPRLD